MLGIDEFTIQLVLDDIGGSNISKETIKTFERFLRCIHRFDEDVLNLGDIKIQNEEDIICVNFRNDSSYFRITQGRIEFYRIFIKSFVITEEEDDIECLNMFRLAIYLYKMDNKMEAFQYYPETEGEILCNYDGL